MEKIRKIVFASLLFAIVCVTAACGRNDTDNGNGTTAGTSQATESSSETGMETESMEPASSMGETAEESGGVLRDMVDGVEDGIDDLGSELKPRAMDSGTTP